MSLDNTIRAATNKPGLDWNQLNQLERAKLIEEYGEPFVLKNITIEITGKTNAGHCPGNETALAAMMFVLADKPVDDPMSLKVRDRMRSQHNIEMIGPIIHFNVDGINPRIMFTGLVIDAAGNIFKPGMFYTYSHRNREVLASLVSHLGVNGIISPLADTSPVTLELEEVRAIGGLPMYVKMTQLQDMDGRRDKDYGPSVVASYFRSILMNEAMESGEEEEFYTTLLKELPEIFAKPDLLVNASPKRDILLEARVGHPVDYSVPIEQRDRQKYFSLAPGKTYLAFRNPLNTVYPESYATYIIQGNDGDYFFVPAYELTVFDKHSIPA